MISHGTAINVLLHNSNSIAIANVGICLAHCAHDRNSRIPFPFPNRHNALLEFVKKPECPMWVCSDSLMPCPLCFVVIQGAVECRCLPLNRSAG